MKEIIKKGKEKTKIEKQNEKIYKKKCWNCKSIFIYDNTEVYGYDKDWVRCPNCQEPNWFLIKIRYRKKMK